MTRDDHSNSEGCVEKLRVLADNTRLAVLRALIDGARHVNELADEIDVEQSLLSHHLRTLRESGLVQAERDGKSVLYRLTPGTLAGPNRTAIDLGCCLIAFDRPGENK